MIPHASPLFKIADRIADAVNPLLALGLILFLVAATRKKEIDSRSWLAAALGIALAFGLHAVDNRLHLWPKIGADYSTHSAICAALLIPLAFLRPRWWPLCAGVLALYAALMMMLGFHTLLDIVSTLLIVASLILLAHFLLLCKPVARNAENEIIPA